MEKNYFKELSIQQRNQLRIALITISVGLTAFLSKDIDSTITLETNGYLIISAISSSAAVICGLLAWKFSSKMFYDMGDGIVVGINHKLKGIFDLFLAVLLAVAIIMSTIYLTKERKLSHNKQIHPSAEMQVGRFAG